MHDDPSPAPVPIGAGLSVAPAGRVSMPSAEVAPREFVTCRQRAFRVSRILQSDQYDLAGEPAADQAALWRATCEPPAG